MIAAQAWPAQNWRGQPWVVAAFMAVVVLTAWSFMSADHLGRACVLLLVAPLTEEIIFRGGLQEALLTRWAASRHASNLITAVVFGLAHVAVQRDWIGGLAVMLPALVMGDIYGRKRRLAPCILAHMGMNACWLLLWGHGGLGALSGA
jgi:membrane protease YdiL (CAAX protease family)